MLPALFVAAMGFEEGIRPEPVALGECGVQELEAGDPLQGGAWRLRTTAKYTTQCPYLQDKVRYNCVNKSTTADDFEFQFSPSQCSARSTPAPLHMLAGDHLHLCGDSHARQVLLEILCSNASRIRRYNGALPPDPTGQPYLVSDRSDTCATAQHYYPPNYWGGGRVLPNGKCWVGTRLEPPKGQDGHPLYIAELDNNVTISFVFLREIGTANHGGSEREREKRREAAGGIERAVSCLSTGVKAAGPRGQPSVIVYNAFVTDSAMLPVLARAGYAGRAIAIPRWGKGKTSNRGPKCPAERNCTHRYPVALDSRYTGPAARHPDSKGL